MTGATAGCAHLETIAVGRPEQVEGCEECLKTGGRWVHLRVCRECGKVGCCDDSPNRHATAHFRESGHPLVTSVEPREHWTWCYEDELLFRLEGD